MAYTGMPEGLTSRAQRTELGRRLARQRLARNVTQEALAESAGVGLRTLRRIEAGEPSGFDSVSASTPGAENASVHGRARLAKHQGAGRGRSLSDRRERDPVGPPYRGGFVGRRERNRGFEYDPRFVRAGIEVSPVVMPVRGARTSVRSLTTGRSWASRACWPMRCQIATATP